MAKQHTVFKVVRRTSKGLKSCIISGLYKNSTWCLTYTPDEWTEARPGTGILVFRCQAGANLFAKDRSSLEIWESIAEGEILLPPYRAREWETRRFGRMWKECFQSSSCLLWPQATAAFRRIRLVESR